MGAAWRIYGFKQLTVVNNNMRDNLSLHANTLGNWPLYRNTSSM